MSVTEDTIVALIEDDESSEVGKIGEIQKRLLKLEEEFRVKFNQWECPPVKLETEFLPNFSI